MIELKFTGPCERCAHRDLFLEKSDMYQDGKVYATSCEVHCNHEDICEFWIQELEKFKIGRFQDGYDYAILKAKENSDGQKICDRD